MADVAHSFLLVCEGPSDPETIAVLADRVSCAEHDWLDGILDKMRRYVGAKPDEAFIRWDSIDRICEEKGVPRVHGLGYTPGRRWATRVLRLALKLEVTPTAVLLVHDSDGKVDEWRKSLEAARTEQSPRFAVVIGVAHPEREAWVLAGFEPRTPEEQTRCDKLRAELGFNPCHQGERLTSSREIYRKDAKRALGRLTNGSRDRELACLRDTALDTLKVQGEGVGLCAFLDELRERLAPCYVRT